MVQVGRLRPRATPGLYALDGVQAGWRSPQGETEAGVFGGLLPTSDLLGFSTSQWAAGAYGTTRLVKGQGDGSAMVQADARAGWASRPNLGTRFEAGVAVHGWLGRRVDAHAQALLSSGSPLAPSVVDSLSLDLGVRASDRLRLHADVRYRGNPALETVLPGVELPTTRGLHGGVDGWFELFPWLDVGVRGGAARDTEAALWAGPELALTQLLGGRAVVAAGYEEDFGPYRGRSVWTQATLTPSKAVRLTGRASWAMQKSATSLGPPTSAAR